MHLPRTLLACAVAAVPALAAAPPASGPPEPGVSMAMWQSPRYRCVTNYYVSPAGGSGANLGTQADPWHSLQDANDSGRLAAGACVNVLPGTYPVRGTIWLNRGGADGSAAGYVVYRSSRLGAARIVATQATYSLIGLQVPYLVVDGFDVDGAGLTREYLLAGASHHEVIVNNRVHDSGGGGIGFARSGDYSIVSHNDVYRTSATALEQESGISYWQPLAAGRFRSTPEDETAYRIVVAYNLVYDNRQTFSCAAARMDAGCHTDGNGIIIDSTRVGLPYPGRILVLGNACYGNGGSGIRVFRSAGVTVAGNTVYGNDRDPDNDATLRGELSNVASADTLWVNNIAVSVPGPGILARNRPIVDFSPGGAPGDGGLWMSNVGFGAGVFVEAAAKLAASANLIGVDPRLRNPASGDLVPRPDSPVRGAGLPQPYLAALRPDIGAY